MSQCSADAQQRGDAVRHPRKRGGEVGGEKREVQPRRRVRHRWTEDNMSVRKNNRDGKKSREKSGRRRRCTTEEKAGNRETAGTLGHGGWMVPC